ncbi:MAG: metallophosphoesterase [Clostridia bacterium]|nr:metallophosphoesterase [Clostridia bacterium]
MKTIVALSDTHGNVQALESLTGLFSECDYIVHLGDGARDMKNYYADYGNKIYQVNGNCDVMAYGLKYFVLEVEKVRILLTHGDVYGVKNGLNKVKDYAKSLDCSVVLYGHTHQAEIQEIEGVMLINPGSLSYFTTEKSIAYVIVNGEKVVAKINKTAVKN